MKFAAILAAFAVSASAINLEADTAAATKATAEVAATTEASAEAGSGWSGPIVPESYDYAVHDFDLNQPFTDQECYTKQVDIYSDQIIAIEALRLEVLQLTQRITQAEHDIDHNQQKIAQNKSKITANSNEALLNKAKIQVLYKNVSDVGDCLHRQWAEQAELRRVLELYCHQFTYVAHLPYQCAPILGANSMLYPSYAWPTEGPHDDHHDHYDDHMHYPHY